MKKLLLASAAGLLLVGLAGGASAATVVGAETIHITSADPNTGDAWLQVAEVVALDFSTVDVALAANGGVASAPNQYSDVAGPANANDGALPYARSYYVTPGIYHSGSPGPGSYLDITFSGPRTLASLSIYGRTDYDNGRDVYNVDILDAHGASLYSGVLNANNDGNVGSVSFDRPVVGVPEPATWGLMIVGFGGMGAVLRNRRRQGLAAA